jgi:hypothetical protein
MFCPSHVQKKKKPFSISSERAVNEIQVSFQASKTLRLKLKKLPRAIKLAKHIWVATLHRRDPSFLNSPLGADY